MNPDLDFEEAARLVERARDLLRLHRETNPGVGYYLRQWPADINGLRHMARHERDNQRSQTARLFA